MGFNHMQIKILYCSTKESQSISNVLEPSVPQGVLVSTYVWCGTNHGHHSTPLMHRGYLNVQMGSYIFVVILN